MRLTRVAARDFMAFAELDIDFSRIEEAVLVGKNGAGKTSLFDVVRFTLYGRHRFKRVDLNVRDDTEQLWTCVEFDTADGQHVRVERSKARGKAADIHVWVGGPASDDDITLAVDPATGKATQHTNAETEADIARLVGLPYETIIAGPWMIQKDAGLMAADPTEGMRLLVKLFDADWCAPLHEAAKKSVAVAEAKAASARDQVERLSTAVAREPDLLASRERGQAMRDETTKARKAAQDALGAVTVRLTQSRTRIERHATLKATRDRLTASIRRDRDEAARLQSIVDAADVAIAAAEPVMPDIPEPDVEAMTAAEAQLLTARAAESRAGRLQAEAEGLDRDWRREKERHAVLGTVPCGGEGIYATCPFLVSVPRQEALDAMRTAVASKHNEAQGAAAAASQVAVLDATVRRISTEVREADAARARAERTISEWRHQRAAAIGARDQHAATIASLKDRETADQSLLEAAEAELRDIEKDFATIVADEAQEAELRDTIRLLDPRIAQVEAGIAQVEGQLAFIAQSKIAIADYETAAATAAAEAETQARLVKAFHVTGIPTLIVENGIAAIEDRANEVLARLPQDFRIELRTQRERVKGGAMDTLDVVVTTNGRERDFDGLSVGQQFRVNLALRVGLATVMADRSGTQIETLWLDEPLADLDEEGRDAAVEALTALASDFPLIIVVSHHPEFNDRFQSTIVVEQDSDGISTARIA